MILANENNGHIILLFKIGWTDDMSVVSIEICWYWKTEGGNTKILQGVHEKILFWNMKCTVDDTQYFKN